jgi:acetolactate synthase-1/2/3 large subunit
MRCGTTTRDAGRPGTVGDRGGNMVTQSADLLFAPGSRLNIRQVSYNWQLRPRGVQIWVDIDPLELRKPTVRPGILVVADLADLLPRLNALAYGADHGPSRMAALGARTQCAFPTVLPEYRDHGPTNHPYVAMDALFDALDDDDIVVTGNGSACVVGFQVARIQKGQRLWTNSAVRRWLRPARRDQVWAATGGDRRVICIAGDGSIMMNLQEMQTIAGYDMPVKVFLLNNAGYVSIFQTHRKFFNGVEVGGGPKSNVTFPDFARLSDAFGFSYARADNHARSAPRLPRRSPRPDLPCARSSSTRTSNLRPAGIALASRRTHHFARARRPFALPPA